MKKSIMLMAALWALVPAGAQKLENKVTRQEITVGEFTENHSPLKGVEYTFTTRINSFDYHPASGCYVTDFRQLNKSGSNLKNKGYLAAFDPQADSLCWFIKNNYLQTHVSYQHGYLLLYTGMNYLLQCNDVRTGKKRWRIKGFPWKTHPNPPVIFFHDSPNAHSETEPMTVFSLETGKELWRRDIPRLGGWNDIEYPNDSTMLVASMGLHWFDLRTGKGWDYDTETVRSDYSGLLLTAGLGIFAGAIGGTFVIPLGGPNVRGGYSSNILSDSNTLWFSSRDEMACLSNQGEVKWKHENEKYARCASYLWATDTLVYRLLLGMVTDGYDLHRQGEPRLDAFHKASGRLLFSHPLGNKRDYIRHFERRGDTLCLFQPGQVTLLHVPELKTIATLSQDTTGGLPEGMLWGNYYRQLPDSTYEQVTRNYKGGYGTYNDNEQVILLDAGLHPLDIFPQKDLLKVVYQLGEGTTLLKRGTTLIAIDNTGKPFATLTTGGGSIKFYRDRLTFANDNKLTEVSLTTFPM